MSTGELVDTKHPRYLDHGDVVTVDGEKYLCEQQSQDENHCGFCAFSGYRCRLPKELNYDCSNRWVAMIKIEDIIKREQKEIEEHKRYIEYLKEL